MLLTLGLPADAAAAHRHEFSRIPPLSQQGNVNALDSSQGHQSTLPTGSFHRPADSWTAMARSFLPASFSPCGSTTDETGPSIDSLVEGDQKDSSQEQESEEDAFSQDGVSSNGQVSSLEGLHEGSSKRRSRRQAKTVFQIAHPPPKLVHRQRLHMRPKLLLQLQHISTSSRPMPALDVLPTTTLPPRLAKKSPRFFKRGDRLGPQDLVIVGTDEFGSLLDDYSIHEGWESRHVVATISQKTSLSPFNDEIQASSKAIIRLNRGPVWAATQLPSGIYELTADDDKGGHTTARWVPRRSRPGRRVSTSTTTRSSEVEKRLTFSLMNPQSRRHPVASSLTPQTLEIVHIAAPETTSSSTSPLSSPPSENPPQKSSREPLVQFCEPGPNNLVKTDDLLKELILISGIWVALCEGWSQHFKYESMEQSNQVNGRPKKTNGAHQRSASTSQTQRPSKIHLPSKSMREKLTHSGSHLAHPPTPLKRNSSAHPTSTQTDSFHNLEPSLRPDPPSRVVSSSGTSTPVVETDIDDTEGELTTRFNSSITSNGDLQESDSGPRRPDEGRQASRPALGSPSVTSPSNPGSKSKSKVNNPHGLVSRLSKAFSIRRANDPHHHRVSGVKNA